MATDNQKRRRYTDDDRLAGLAAIEIFGSLSGASNATGYSRRTLQRWREEATNEVRDDARNVVAEVVEGVEPRLQRLLDAYITRLEANVRNISPRDLPTGLGILIDKLERLRGGRLQEVPDLSKSPAELADEIEAILRSAHASDPEGNVDGEG